MKVEINIDNDQLNELLEGNLDKVSESVIQEIIVNSIKEYFAQDNYSKIENLFIKTENRGGYYTEKTATLFLEKLAKDCDYSKLQEVVDAAIENLKKNNETILRKILLDAMVEGLSRTYPFRESVEEVIRDYKILNQ